MPTTGSVGPQAAHAREVIEGLRDVLGVLNSSRSLDQILGYVVAEAGRLLGGEASSVYRLDTVANVLTIQASQGLDPDYALSVRIPYGEGTVGQAVQTGRPVTIENLILAVDDPRVLRLSPEQQALVRWLAERYRALLTVPVLIQGEPYGALTIYYREPRVFAADAVALAVAFGEQAALAIENARLRVETERRSRLVEALYRADEALHSSLRLSHVLQAFVDVAAELLRADKTSILVWDERGERLVMGATHGFGPEARRMSLRPGEGIAGVVVSTRRPVVLEDAPADGRVVRVIVEREAVRSLMAIPIVVGGQVFGVFGVNYLEPHRFTAEEQRVLLALAQRTALAIDNARLYEQAQQAAVLEERQRLARELHDSVTQTLFSATLTAEVLPRLWRENPDEAEEQLEELRQLTRGALAEMRALLLELRPAALLEVPLGDLLKQLCAAFIGRARVPADLLVEGNRVLPPDVQTAFYRLAQEALNNVAKHADARRVAVALTCGRRRTELRVTDDGRGFDPERVELGHLGLGIMRERVAAIGATVDVISAAGQGTAVTVVWEDSRPEEE